VDFDLSPELLELQAEALEVGRTAAAQSPLTEDTWIAAPDRAFSLELAKRGWLGMTWPAAVGGGGRSPLERFIVYEALLSTGAPMATSWFADRQMGPTLLQFGTPEQQQEHLPRILDGTSAWSIGMSEPDAGSDVASIRTRAVRDGDHFVVNGQKIWNSGAMSADWIYLICRTDPDVPAHQGMSELIVDMRSPGIAITPIEDMTGTNHFCEVFLEDVRVPVENLVGELHGSFRQVMRQMEHERGGPDRLLSNRKLYDDCRAVADTGDPRVRQEIAAIETGYRIGRLLVLREVIGQAPKQFSAATKTFCTELEQRIAQFCAATMGPNALLTEPGLGGRVARGVCYAPAYTIMGGTSQILRNILGERVLGLPR
jgi:alkylation response protein AidB-like acyl-CoA dehydrogenase